MAAINWPSTLPQTFQEGSYREDMEDSTIRDEFDTGPAGVRSRNTAAPYTIRGAMFMTTAQWEILKDFVRTDLLRMTQAFGFPEQGASAPGTLLVRFSAAPSRSPALPDWLVSLELEVLP